MVREDKTPHSRSGVHEDEEDGEVLDPAPLEELPHPGTVGEALLGVVELGGHRELVTGGPGGPQTVVIRQVDRQISE